MEGSGLATRVSGVLEAAKRLRGDARALAAKLDVAYAYHPLDYAWAPHETYATRFGVATPRRAVLVGMNPGPWGMGQTGVPFGDVARVRDWMGITGRVDRPARLHPKRPVTGFDTTRKEPSGSRLYGWAEKRYGPAERFFADFYVVNYCPLLFFDEDGKNLTPPQLRKADRDAIDAACDAHLAAVLRALRPEHAIGVGAYAAERVSEVVEREKLSTRAGQILHPSPASPLANKGWEKLAEAQLHDMGALPAR